ncbi:hypothetical protein OROMI_028041 [Orobanche minor]
MTAVCLIRKLSIFFTLFSISSGSVSAAPPSGKATAPAPDCLSVVMGMSSCLSFVMAGSKTTEPESSCCAGLNTVLDTGGQIGAKCLCESFNNRGSVGIRMNVTKALYLPDACDIKFPTVANCTFGNASASAPAPVRVPDRSRSPLTVPPSSVRGNPSSGSSSPVAAIHLLLCAALAAVFFI